MITYMTLPGDTLEKIASDLKVENPVYLKEFHNTCCARHDRLTEPVQLNAGMLLHIPFGDDIKKLNRKISENGDSLYYHPPYGKIPFKIALLEGSYTIRHQKYLDSTLLNNYSYQTELKYLKSEKDQHFFTVKIFGSMKDGHESDSKISSLAKACAAIIFPLEIRTNETGKLISAEFCRPETAVKNELELLKKYFTDQWSASYIDQMKKKAEDKTGILENIRHMLPVHFLFGSFYKAKYGDWTDSGIYHEFFPWLTNASPIRFELYNRILPKEPDTHEVLKIIQKGTSCDYRNLDQLYDTQHEYHESLSLHEHSVVCRHEAEYSVNRDDMEVQKITGNFEIRIGNVTEKEVFTLEKQLK